VFHCTSQLAFHCGGDVEFYILADSARQFKRPILVSVMKRRHTSILYGSSETRIVPGGSYNQLRLCLD
jgi:hypothetical protein